VLTCFNVSIGFSETVINEIDDIAGFIPSKKKIFWFEVSV